MYVLVIYYLKSVLHCLPNKPEIPAANPPTTPVTRSNKVEFPLSFKSVAIFSANIKSLVLLSRYDCIIHNNATAIKGTKNTAPFFNVIKTLEINAATITDHHGKYNESTYANIIVNMKFFIFLFI